MFGDHLVEPTPLKSMSRVKLDHFPKDQGENKTSLKPPPNHDITPS